MAETLILRFTCNRFFSSYVLVQDLSIIDVERFYAWLLKATDKSECFLKFKNRLTKYREKLFEFLNHDNIPWNNNNAEHAIKIFAAYRKIADGTFSESGLKTYLPLLSIYQTCKYKNIDFLKFLLSKETDIDEFAGI